MHYITTEREDKTGLKTDNNTRKWYLSWDGVGGGGGRVRAFLNYIPWQLEKYKRVENQRGAFLCKPIKIKPH